MNIEETYSASEVAKILGYNRNWVYQHKVEIGCFKACRKLRFPKSKVIEFFNKHFYSSEQGRA